MSFSGAYDSNYKRELIELREECVCDAIIEKPHPLKNANAQWEASVTFREIPIARKRTDSVGQSPRGWLNEIEKTTRLGHRVKMLLAYLRNSQESSKAVRIGSFEESAMREGEARARYAFILLRECRSESSIREVTHSSQPHLKRGTKSQTGTYFS